MTRARLLMLLTPFAIGAAAPPVAVAADPVGALAADPAGATHARDRAGLREAERGSTAAREVEFEPLFDTKTRFKSGKTFRLRFRAHEKRTGKPISAEDIFVSLLSPSEPAIRLSPRKVKGAVCEVPFKPRRPGRYTLVVAVRGAPVAAIPPLNLGVVGMAAGVEEVDDPALDAELEARSKRLKVKGR